MPKKMSDEEYYATLPKKQVGTAVLFFDSTGKILVVKPDYKDSWLVPGGSADDGESPLQCAVRETKEEIGIDLTSLDLIAVYFSRAKGLYPDSLKFIFSGGVLSPSQVESIVLQPNELIDYKFLLPDEAILLMSSSLRASVPAALAALRNNTVAYIDA